MHFVRSNGESHLEFGSCGRTLAFPELRIGVSWERVEPFINYESVKSSNTYTLKDICKQSRIDIMSINHPINTLCIIYHIQYINRKSSNILQSQTCIECPFILFTVSIKTNKLSLYHLRFDFIILSEYSIYILSSKFNLLIVYSHAWYNQ